MFAVKGTKASPKKLPSRRTYGVPNQTALPYD
jgi:hypothetical protein